MRFREKFTECDRKQKSKKLTTNHPDRIPVIVEKDPECRLEALSMCKMLIPKTMNMGQLSANIRNKIELSSEQALYFLVNNQLIPGSHNMMQVYQEHKDPDGFLYVVYTAENTFG